MKKLFSLVLALSMALALTACSGSADTDSTTDDTTETTAEPVELHVFAAASMQESLRSSRPTRPWLRKSPSWRLMTPPAP